MEEIIEERPASLGCRRGSIFRKYYKYASLAETEKEAENARIVHAAGIFCPQHIELGYSKERNMFFNDFQFHNISKLNVYELSGNDWTEIKHFLSSMPKMSVNVPFGQTCYFQQIRSALAQYSCMLSNELQELMSFTGCQISEKFMHGDFSLENIGRDLSTGKLILFDFQSSGNGPAGWDRAYMLASCPWQVAEPLLRDTRILPFVKIISALKYARGIRKNYELELRKENYEHWFQIK